MSESFSFEGVFNNLESSSLRESRTPPPLETALSSSDQYSPATAADSSTGSSPNPTFATTMTSLTNGRGSSAPKDFPGHAHDSSTTTTNGGQNARNLTWRADIQPDERTSSAVPYVFSSNPAAESEPLVQSSTNVNRSPHGEDDMKDASLSADEDTPKDRRQKRLERNRESARLSRRRRKHYLEELESKVTELSDVLDKGRRQHVAQALPAIQALRSNGVIHPFVARTSTELRVATTFASQQMQSFFTPPSTKFILWLTLQNDAYFRGGRANSERLSAARIGERMLYNGNDKVTPAQSMWPLFCNEIALSYDQEERVRSYQKTLLADKESWLERHTAFAAAETLKAKHEALQAVSFRLGHRERTTDITLTAEQRVKLSGFVGKHRAALAARLSTEPQPYFGDYKPNKDQHVSNNLYILHHRLRSIMQTIQPAAPLLTGSVLKKLSRRPSFESLGVLGDKKENDDHDLSRDCSFASSGSLKRSLSEMSMDGEERPHVQSISPRNAEATAMPYVESVMAHLQPIMPTPKPAPPVHFKAPLPPRPVASAPVLFHPTAEFLAQSVVPTPLAASSFYDPFAADMAEAATSATPSLMKHQRNSSFLPPGLNVVPEEMWPTDAVAEEYLMSLADEDWAIGGGIDMDL